MAPIYTLLGVPYVAVLDPERGIVLRKAARKRVASPGQMSLFGSNDPKEGDTKVENGVTYRLNQHSRWERADKAKGKAKAKPKAVVPVVEEKTEVESKPSDIVNMRQEEDTGSRRDETPAMPNFDLNELWIANTQTMNSYQKKQHQRYRMSLLLDNQESAMDALWRAANNADLLSTAEHSHTELSPQRISELLNHLGWS